MTEESTPQRYKKKPIVIEAVRLTKDNAAVVIEWAHAGMPAMANSIITPQLAGCLSIRTMEGTMHAIPGDWIIRGVQGEFYPCKHEIFAATYDPA